MAQSPVRLVPRQLVRSGGWLDLREGKMGRRIARDRRPGVEQCERRELLSGITDVMAGKQHRANMRAIAATAAANAGIEPLDRGTAESGSAAQSGREHEQRGPGPDGKCDAAPVPKTDIQSTLRGNIHGGSRPHD